MLVGMIQSNFLPWRGYFDFIDDVELFVIYDDVQYTRKDWRNRNKIKCAHGLQWITVPVQFSHKNPVNIENARIDYQHYWQRKMIVSITQAYKSTPYFSGCSEKLFEILEHKYSTISELNVDLIRWVMKELSITVPIEFSSQFPQCTDRNERIIDILSELNATDYLVGPAAGAYIDHDAYKSAEIGLLYKSYNYRQYPQLHGEYEGNVSILDLLFNCGDGARDFLKSDEPNLRVV